MFAFKTNLKKIVYLALSLVLVLSMFFISNSQAFAQGDEEFDPLQGPTGELLENLNPLGPEFRPGGGPDLSSPGAVVSQILVFAFPIAGLILFLMLVWGGFEILLGAANNKMVDAGKQRATAAVVGFLLLFSSYWITQIVEVIFGIAIL